MLAACKKPGTAVTVPDSAGRIGGIDIGNVTDCDITLGYGVVLDFIYMGHLPGSKIAPSHRVRVRGGRIGAIWVDPGSTDIVFDSVVVDNDVNGAPNRRGGAIFLAANSSSDSVNRFGFVNSMIRMLPVDAAGFQDGNAYIGDRARNVFFANNNIITAGNRNSWAFRVQGGYNFIAVDNAIRVSYHKLIRMNTYLVDYVYVKGGIWMRENTTSPVGTLNDSFQDVGGDGTDNIFIHDTEVYNRSDLPMGFGASFFPEQNGKSWEARRISWHAVDSSVISDNRLLSFENGCAPTAVCDYGIGTHTYDYDPTLNFPTNPWRNLPALPEDNPDNLTTAH